MTKDPNTPEVVEDAPRKPIVIEPTPMPPAEEYEDTDPDPANSEVKKD